LFFYLEQTGFDITYCASAERSGRQRLTCIRGVDFQQIVGCEIFDDVGHRYTPRILIPSNITGLFSRLLSEVSSTSCADALSVPILLRRPLPLMLTKNFGLKNFAGLGNIGWNIPNAADLINEQSLVFDTEVAFHCHSLHRISRYTRYSVGYAQ